MVPWDAQGGVSWHNVFGVILDAGQHTAFEAPCLLHTSQFLPEIVWHVLDVEALSGEHSGFKSQSALMKWQLVEMLLTFVSAVK